MGKKKKKHKTFVQQHVCKGLIEAVNRKPEDIRLTLAASQVQHIGSCYECGSQLNDEAQLWVIMEEDRLDTLASVSNVRVLQKEVSRQADMRLATILA